MNLRWRGHDISAIHATIGLSLLLHGLVMAWSPPWLHQRAASQPGLLEVRLQQAVPHVVSEPALAPRPTPLAPLRTLRPLVAPSPQTEASPPLAPSEPVAAPQPAPVAAAPVTPPTVTPPDLRAAYLANPRPPYPLAARRLGLEGKVILRVEILENGSVAQVRLARSSGHELLDQSALQAVKQWRFVPAQRAGEAVAASVEVPIRFSLHEAAAAEI